MLIKDLIAQLEKYNQELEVLIEVSHLPYRPAVSLEGKKLILKATDEPPSDMEYGPGDDSNTDVHTGHCCYFCACKYGDVDCSVITGKLKQEHPHYDTSVCYELKPSRYNEW
jgi:hypothetical protein